MTDSRPLDILTICGSLRKASLHLMLQNTLPELAPEGMKLDPWRQLHGWPMYDHDIQDQGFPEVVTELADRIRAADGLIYISPEYNWSVAGALKNAIDWMSRLPNQPFKDKPCLIQSVAGGLLGGSRAQYHLRQVMYSLEGAVFTRPEVIIAFAGKKFEGGRLIDEESRAVVKQQLAAYEGWIRKHYLNG